MALVLMVAAMLPACGPPEARDEYVAVGICDFSTYPPTANLDVQCSGCVQTLQFDERPHLLFVGGADSGLTLGWKLPHLPKSMALRVTHLASANEQGVGDAQIDLHVNDQVVAKNWKLARPTYFETEWDLSDALRPGENQLRIAVTGGTTHYWLRRCLLTGTFDRPVAFAQPAPRAQDELLSETRFSQCSYNALATILHHFYGIEPVDPSPQSLANFERASLVCALEPDGLQDYFGWGPWTSFMVKSGRLRWNGHPVDDLRAERFALATAEMPRPKENEMIVHFGAGEREKLCQALSARLEQGPVLVWTPYAAAMDQGEKAWQHVRSIDKENYAVRFLPRQTHSVVVNREQGELKVYDCSRFSLRPWPVDEETIVATAAAMVGQVELHRTNNGHPLLQKPLRGVTAPAFNVVFWRPAPIAGQ